MKAFYVDALTYHLLTIQSCLTLSHPIWGFVKDLLGYFCKPFWTNSLASKWILCKGWQANGGHIGRIKLFLSLVPSWPMFPCVHGSDSSQVLGLSGVWPLPPPYWAPPSHLFWCHYWNWVRSWTMIYMPFPVQLCVNKVNNYLSKVNNYLFLFDYFPTCFLTIWRQILHQSSKFHSRCLEASGIYQIVFLKNFPLEISDLLWSC